ncbi:expressed unknown protein [Seminavis robusta]|uniref:Uncharacterized protein n=1 Tax=Seminavis robusta TaxID=568900 RepID=A0A9N8HDU5_9STRA|nr:expressed unknown protein [Seminavis robusta]|eukprot:Sro480_g151280.1 n/a (937) ;mRNA; f:5206-8016
MSSLLVVLSLLLLFALVLVQGMDNRAVVSNDKDNELSEEDEEDRNLLMLTMSPEGDDPFKNSGLFGQNRTQPPEEVVRLRFDLDLSGSSTTAASDGDFESFLCHLDAYYSQAVGGSTVYLSHGKWMRNSIVIVDAFVLGMTADELLLELDISTDKDRMNAWMQQHYNPQEPYAWHSTTTAITKWEGKVVPAPTNFRRDYFSTADNCGVARVTLQFEFDDDLQNPTTQEDIDNLLCSSRAYFTVLFDQLYHYVQQQQGNNYYYDSVHIDIDRMDFKLDSSPSSGVPLTVDFDLRANLASTSRRVPALQVLEWMQYSYWDEYIQEAVWETQPYQTSPFFNTKIVQYYGHVRTLTEPLPAATPDTTNDCDGGIMMVPERHYYYNNSDNTDITTSWMVEFGFQDGFAGAGVPPTPQDVQQLFCQTFFQLQDMLQLPPRQQQQPPRPLTTAQARPQQQQQPYHVHETFVDLELQCYDWVYNPDSPYPFQFFLTAHANIQTTSSEEDTRRRVDPQLLWDKMQQRFVVQGFFDNYVWKGNPPGSYFYHADEIRMDGGVIPTTNVTGTVKLSSNECVRQAAARPQTSGSGGGGGGGGSGGGGSGGGGFTLGGVGQGNNHVQQQDGDDGPGSAERESGDNTEENNQEGGAYGNSNNPGNLANGSPFRPIKSTPKVTIASSAIAVHGPDEPVSKDTEQLSRAVKDMLSEMIQGRPKRGTVGGSDDSNAEDEEAEDQSVASKTTANNNEPPKTRGRRLQANIDLDTVFVGEPEAPKDCSYYFGQQWHDDSKVCTRIPILYDVEVVAENPVEVENEFVVMTQVAITQGLLQEKLTERDPTSSLTIVPDPGKTYTVTTTVVAQVQSSPPPSPAPSSSSEDDDDKKKDADKPPGWVIAVIVLLSVAILATAVLILRNHLKWHRQRRQRQQQTGETDLLKTEEKEAYHHVI